MKILAVHFILILGITPAFGLERIDGTWPEIREFDVTIGVSATAGRVDIVIPFSDKTETTLYTLRCRGGNKNAVLDDHYAPEGIVYAGLLGCYLNEGESEYEGSLLAEDDSPPWHTRGQFHYYQLVGVCGVYPEYGTLRHFRLRGFELTFEVLDLLVQSGIVEYFLLNISLRNKPEASSAYAEQPGYLSPYRAGRSCEKIVNGNDPRMCRNSETYSWEQCTSN